MDGERIDVNYDLRMRICEYYRPDLSPCATRLLLDLYRSLAESSTITFSVYSYFHLFASEILERDGTTHFDIYQEGAWQSFDTLLSSARLNLSQPRLEELRFFLQERMEQTEEVESRERYAFMLKRFQGLAPRNP